MDKKTAVQIDQLKQGNREAIKLLYSHYYKACMKWIMKQFEIQEQVFKVSYQNAVIAVYEAALDGKLDKIQSDLKTYVFETCRHHLIKQNSLAKKYLNLAEEVDVPERSYLNEEQITDEALRVGETISQMEEPCKTILKGVFYHKTASETLSKKLGFISEKVLEVQKSRCLNFLRGKV